MSAIAISVAIRLGAQHDFTDEVPVRGVHDVKQGCTIKVHLDGDGVYLVAAAAASPDRPLTAEKPFWFR